MPRTLARSTPRSRASCRAAGDARTAAAAREIEGDAAGSDAGAPTTAAPAGSAEGEGTTLAASASASALSFRTVAKRRRREPSCRVERASDRRRRSPRFRRRRFPFVFRRRRRHRRVSRALRVQRATRRAYLRPYRRRATACGSHPSLFSIFPAISTIVDTLGSAACSRCHAYGMGTSALHTRATGASRS